MVIIAFAITPLPYGIYPWLKFIIMSWFAWFALLSFNNGRIAWTLFWLAFLVLFNPFWPFILGKDGWVIVDLFMICALLFWMYDGETEWIEYEKDDEDAEDAS